MNGSCDLLEICIRVQIKYYNPIYNLQAMSQCDESDKLYATGYKKMKKEIDNKNMLPTSPHEGWYEIRVRGHLDDSWSDWLEGLEVKLFDNGDMILFGHIGDQAALMGVLNKLYRLNLTLLCVSEATKSNKPSKT